MSALRNNKIGGGRIDYIDWLKGMAIFCVLWLHSSACPECLTPPMVNSLFFFLSGAFFKPGVFSDFICKRAGTLLVPFLFFYLMSYPFRMVVYFWDNRTLCGFDWGCLWDVFDCVARADYLFVNVPLWFLLCLFVVQLMYWLLCKLPIWCAVLVAVSALLAAPEIERVPTPLMINNAVYWLAFFALGHVFGKKLLSAFTDWKKALVAMASAVVFMLLSLWGQLVPVSALSERVAAPVFLLSCILLVSAVMALLSRFNPPMTLLRYWGENTLIILGIHIWFGIPLKRISHRLFEAPTVWCGFVEVLLTLLCCWVFIKCAAPRIPYLVGKKNFLLRSTRS